MSGTVPRRLHPAIFREYDIRGVAGDTLTPDDAYRIARAFAARALEVSDPVVCVARDGRVSSPQIADAVVRGLSDSGVAVRDVGLGPTPMLYFASCVSKAAGGIMITGSHNPPDHNGLKFMLHGKAFFGDAIQALRSVADAEEFPVGKGERRTQDMREEYLAVLLRAYDGKALRVAWDAGNGATGEVMEMLCQKLPGEHTPLNGTIDGTFPVHHPDPTVPKNLEQLIGVVKKNKLNCGIAFDGDGDRIGVVDDEGGILWGDQLMMLLAADVLEKHPGETVIADVKASGALFEEIARLGGTPLMWKTGHSHIKSKMMETGALLAGEMSGHIFFADKYYGYDDALYAAVRLLGFLSRSGKKLSDLRKALPQRVNTPEIRFACDDERKFAVIGEVKARLRQKSAEFSDIDGVRVTTPDGWWLLRASNTQPMLVARAEAMDAAGLARLKSELAQELAASRIDLP